MKVSMAQATKTLDSIYFLIELPTLHNDLISWHCDSHKQQSKTHPIIVHPQEAAKDNGKPPQVVHLKEQEDGDGKVKSPLMYEIQANMVLYSGHIACWAI